jgi:hypothetical protein
MVDLLALFDQNLYGGCGLQASGGQSLRDI